MRSSLRSKFLWGSGIALIGFLVPGMYVIRYPDYAPVKIPPVELDGVTGTFNGLNGPYHDYAVLGSTIFLFLLGILVRFIEFERAWAMLDKWRTRLQRFSLVGGLAAGVTSVGAFIWQFEGNGLPQAAQDAFVARRGGGEAAVTQSHYLSASIGAPALLVIIGTLIALIGVWPIVAGIINGLLAALLIAFCAGASIGIPLPGVTQYQQIPAADGTRPHTADTCVLQPGGDENCESIDPELEIKLPNPAPGTAGCSYAITVDWGDKSGKIQATAQGTADAVLYSAKHTYKDEPFAYVLTVSETVTAGPCKPAPAAWKPQFAIGVRIGR
jgi:hypothetical protein